MTPAAATPFSSTTSLATIGTDGAVPSSQDGLFGAELATILATPPTALVPAQAIGPSVVPTLPAPPVALAPPTPPATNLPTAALDAAPLAPVTVAPLAPKAVPPELDPMPVADMPKVRAPSPLPTPANGKEAPIEAAAAATPAAEPLAPAPTTAANTAVPHAAPGPVRGTPAPAAPASTEAVNEREADPTPVETADVQPATVPPSPQPVPAQPPEFASSPSSSQGEGAEPAQTKAVAIDASSPAPAGPADIRTAVPEPLATPDPTSASVPALETLAPGSAPDVMPVPLADAATAHAAAFAREVERAAPPPASGPEPTVTARPGQAGRELGLEIARVGREGGDELVVRLDPADLGRVEVRLAWEDGVLAATVRAEQPSALELFRREVADLGRALGEAGVRADTAAFRFEGGGGDGHSARSERPDSDRPTTEREPAPLSTPSESAVRLAHGRIDLIA